MNPALALSYEALPPLRCRRSRRHSSPFLSSSDLPPLRSVQVARLTKCRGLCCSRAAILVDVPKKIALTSLEVTRRSLTRTLTTLGKFPSHIQCVTAAAVIAFALWGLLPSVHFIRRNIFQRREWEKSRTKFVLNSYVKPLMLWVAIIGLCRALDPIVLSSEASQAVKERFLNFLRSLSTVLTFAFCTARMTQQIQRLMMDRHNSEDSRNLGIRFIGSAVSTSVWVAAVCLFMELLGFSTQKWLTAGGFGTVLLTLAGREIFTNFLSSVMIHATRPFVEYEWIQTKIDGQEVSGTVEHVGWWSPTVIRGEDREAVHIPNHKFTMSVVRNLSQKKHWRVKTYIGLSHLDASKINLIVADMRKVLAKHPQVEHRRLHRRVFFDNIDPSNQSLMIMVSCFVKTSHYEEYLSVKEIILLNLLKVISHHNARLATPIRSIQRVYDEAEARQSPNVSMLVEASAVASDHGRPKQEATPAAPAEAAKQQEAEETQHSSSKAAVEGLDSMGLNPKDIPAKVSDVPAEAKTDEQKSETVEKPKQQAKRPIKVDNGKPPKSSKEAAKRDLKLETINEGAAKAKDLQETGKGLSSKPREQQQSPKQQQEVEDDPWKETASTSKQGSEEQPKASSHGDQVKRSSSDGLKRSPSSLEDNLVLGVALAGSKRTLSLSSSDGVAGDESKVASDTSTRPKSERSREQ